MVKIIFSVALVFFCARSFAVDKVRLGWQIPWAVQGQLVQILKHTDIAKKEGLEIEFIGRTYGPLLNELDLSDSVDVILTADQPATILFSKDKGWLAIGRLMYNRTSTYVPLKSKIQNLSELKGAKIGVPIGAAAERVASEALSQSGLNPLSDVEWVNVDIREHMILASKHKDDESFSELQALAGFDPTPAILEAQKLVRPLHVGKVVSLIVASGKVTQNKELTEKLLRAFKAAYEYYRSHQKEADKWFMDEALLKDNSYEACRLAASLEPNLREGQEVSLTLNREDLSVLQKASDFVAKKIGQRIEVKKYIMPQALAL